MACSKVKFICFNFTISALNTNVSTIWLVSELTVSNYYVSWGVFVCPNKFENSLLFSISGYLDFVVRTVTLLLSAKYSRVLICAQSNRQGTKYTKRRHYHIPPSKHFLCSFTRWWVFDCLTRSQIKSVHIFTPDWSKVTVKFSCYRPKQALGDPVD
jgi:hypothetical protein